MAMVNVWIIGGGCYGSGYVRQLRKARDHGKLPPSRWILLDRDSHCRAWVDRDPADSLSLRVGEWAQLIAGAVAAGEIGPGDHLVPSPFQGALVADWLRLEAAAAGRNLGSAPLAPMGEGTRYDQAAGEDQRYVSFADWTCPVHCIEPPRCPATRGPKAWDLRDSVYPYARAAGFDTVLAFPCLHWRFGVGTVPAAAFLAARERIRGGPAGRILLASMSTCHGALTGLELGPPAW